MAPQIRSGDALARATTVQPARASDKRSNVDIWTMGGVKKMSDEVKKDEKKQSAKGEQREMENYIHAL